MGRRMGSLQTGCRGWTAAGWKMGGAEAGRRCWRGWRAGIASLTAGDTRDARGRHSEDRGLPTWRAGMSKRMAGGGGIEYEGHEAGFEGGRASLDRREGWENEGRQTQHF